MSGKVYLIGAGPGDPGLITVKGRDCIAKADVVIYDYLAAPALLAAAGDSAECIYVGKKGGDHTLSQDGINALIVEKAKAGNLVARLKGGDPFIFGRGGEEAEVLVENQIDFEIVPGVTSAIAAPAYAGIPLTHRKHTATVAFVTGHEDPQKDVSNIDWEALARGIGTIVFLMGVKNLPSITKRLIEHGRNAKTPVGVVRWGTTVKQQTVTGTLENIVSKVTAAGLKAPAAVVVGEVVGLRDILGWYEKRPLLGKKIVVTRARAQASDLTQRLFDLGAECLEIPTIKIAAPDDWQPLDHAIENIAAYDWLIFTSVNGVSMFFERLFKKGLDVRALHQVHTACIGPVTARRLLDFGIKSDIMPDNYRAEAVAAAFASVPMQGKKVLLPRALGARPVLPVELAKMDAQVDEVVAYQTEAVADKADLLIEQLNNKSIDMVTFASSSTVKNFKALIDSNPKLVDGVTIACIGPITAQTAHDLGFEVHISAKEYTIAGLCDAIVAHHG
jgi:uroporphyrinogen III methyltransferase / synthase